MKDLAQMFITNAITSRRMIQRAMRRDATRNTNVFLPLTPQSSTDDITIIYMYFTSHARLITNRNQNVQTETGDF